MEFRLRLLLFVVPIITGLGILLLIQSKDLQKARLIFCDVGQGDGMLIVSGTKQVVIDGGPGNRILDCLGGKMPFWDRKIEMVVLTHPQRDHMEGLIAVLARYDVKRVVTTGIGNETDVFRAWEEAVKSEDALVYAPDVGDQFVTRGPLKLSVLWPNREMIEKWQDDPPADLNDSSIVMRLDFGQACAYLTGDIPKETLVSLIDRQCEILKVSHHGSKTGTNEEILLKVNPKVAVIQVGKNSYGHPTKEVLDLLQSKGVKILRNDLEGTIEINLDGQLTINH